MKYVGFCNQIIIKKGENPKCLYKLMHGNAYIVGTHNENLFKIESPCYINLIQSIFDVGSLKTIRAQQKCQIIRIKLKKQHKNILKQMKQNGYRKHIFPIFQDIQSQYFYQLCQYSTQIKLLKNQNFKFSKYNLYAVIEGKFTIMSHNTLRVLSLGQGEIINVKNEQINIETASFVRLMSVPIHLVFSILGKYYQEISLFDKAQHNTILKYQKRNQRLSANLRKNKENVLIVPKQFQNSFQVKLKNLQSYCRSRGCFSESKDKLKPSQKIQKETKNTNICQPYRKQYKTLHNSSSQKPQRHSKTIFSMKNSRSLHKMHQTYDGIPSYKPQLTQNQQVIQNSSQNTRQSYQFTPKYLNKKQEIPKQLFHRFQKFSKQLKKKGQKQQATKISFQQLQK